MKRTTADEHASNLFQDENLPTTAGTLLEETWLNSVQEELAEAIERSGQDLNAASYLQTHEAMLRHGAIVNMVAGVATKEGEWHPQDPATENRTFWVDQTAGLVGEVKPGTIWLRNNAGILTQHNFSTGELAALGLDAKTFTNTKDTYLQIDEDSTITFVETAPAAGEPTPTGTRRNALKIVTTGGNITEVHSMVPAWPEVRARTLYLTDYALEDRDSVDEEGFKLEMLLEGGTGTANLLKWYPWETGVERDAFLEVDDIEAGGQRCDVTWRFADLWLLGGDGAGESLIKWRMHEGTTAENAKTIRQHSLVYDHDGGAVLEDISLSWAAFADTQDSVTVFALVNAVESSDVSRCYAGMNLTLLIRSGGAEAGSGTRFSEDPSTAGVDCQIACDATDILVRLKGEAAKTWRFTVMLFFIPGDATA